MGIKRILLKIYVQIFAFFQAFFLGRGMRKGFFRCEEEKEAIYLTNRFFLLWSYKTRENLADLSYFCLPEPTFCFPEPKYNDWKRKKYYKSSLSETLLERENAERYLEKKISKRPAEACSFLGRQRKSFLELRHIMVAPEREEYSREEYSKNARAK